LEEKSVSEKLNLENVSPIPVLSARFSPSKGAIQKQLNISNGKFNLVCPIKPTLIVKTEPIIVKSSNENITGTKTNWEYMENNINLAEGLNVYTNIFTETEISEIEFHILNDLKRGRDKELIGESYVFAKSREMLLYGYHYQYYATSSRNKGVWNNIPVQPLPPWSESIVSKLLLNNILTEPTDSVIINYYPEHGFIPPHIDHSDFTRPIISIRLLSDSYMSFGGKFDKGAGIEGSKGIKFKVPFPRGGVMSMEGRSGSAITHSIETVDVPQPTASITLRKVLIK